MIQITIIIQYTDDHIYTITEWYQWGCVNRTKTEMIQITIIIQYTDDHIIFWIYIMAKLIMCAVVSST